MDRPIQVGDLVMVVKKCCPEFGLPDSPIFVVESFWQAPLTTKCRICGSQLSRKQATHHTGGDWVGYPVEWLKRIPPLSELEGEKTEEKLKEPA